MTIVLTDSLSLEYLCSTFRVSRYPRWTMKSKRRGLVVKINSIQSAFAHFRRNNSSGNNVGVDVDGRMCFVDNNNCDCVALFSENVVQRTK